MNNNRWRVVTGLLVLTSLNVEGYHRHSGAAVGAGVAGGLIGGAIIGGAIADSRGSSKRAEIRDLSDQVDQLLTENKEMRQELSELKNENRRLMRENRMLKRKIAPKGAMISKKNIE